jgi:predicted DNA-binding transcriptional regulator YafY
VLLGGVLERFAGLLQPFVQRVQQFGLGLQWFCAEGAGRAAASLSGWCQLSPAGHVPRGKAIPADWVLHKVDFESLSQAQFVALGFGPRVRVLAPDELRERVRVDIAAAAAVRTERKRPI